MRCCWAESGIMCLSKDQVATAAFACMLQHLQLPLTAVRMLLGSDIQSNGHTKERTFTRWSWALLWCLGGDGGSKGGGWAGESRRDEMFIREASWDGLEVCRGGMVDILDKAIEDRQEKKTWEEVQEDRQRLAVTKCARARLTWKHLLGCPVESSTKKLQFDRKDTTTRHPCSPAEPHCRPTLWRLLMLNYSVISKLIGWDRSSHEPPNKATFGMCNMCKSNHFHYIINYWCLDYL